MDFTLLVVSLQLHIFFDRTHTAAIPPLGYAPNTDTTSICNNVITHPYYYYMGNCGTNGKDPDSMLKNSGNIDSLVGPALHEGSILGITRFVTHSL